MNNMPRSDPQLNALLSAFDKPDASEVKVAPGAHFEPPNIRMTIKSNNAVKRSSTRMTKCRGKLVRKHGKMVPKISCSSMKLNSPNENRRSGLLQDIFGEVNKQKRMNNVMPNAMPNARNNAMPNARNNARGLQGLLNQIRTQKANNDPGLELGLNPGSGTGSGCGCSKKKRSVCGGEAPVAMDELPSVFNNNRGQLGNNSNKGKGKGKGKGKNKRKTHKMVEISLNGNAPTIPEVRVKRKRKSKGKGKGK
jgi:hypothetical protein